MSDGATEALAVFDGTDDPGTPLTTAEIGDELDCARSNVRERLEALERAGTLESRQLDGDSRVWWRPVDRSGDETDDDLEDEFPALVQAVEEYAIFLLDPNGTIRTWNAGAEQIKGYAEEEIVGEHFSIFYTEDDREAGTPDWNLRTAAEEGSVEDEGWRVRADGTRFWANVTITALYNDDGDVRGFAKVTRDMTERHEREEELRRERELTEQFRLLVGSVEEYAIFMMDEDGHIESWNPGAEQIKGYAEEEIVGEHFSIFYTEEARDAGVPERNLSIAIEEGSVEDEGWRVRADGTQFWANVTITSVEDAEGDLRGFAKVTRDMTERKRREDQLAALNETARELIETESADEVVELMIDAAENDFALPATTVALYDEDRGVLQVEGRTALAERLADDVELFDVESDVVWDVFGEREPHVETGVEAVTGGAEREARITAAAAYPLGRHGVLIVGFSTPGGPSEAELEFPKLVAADLEAALNHAERQQLLVEREATLEEQNATLERLNRINGVIRQIDEVLVDATSRDEIEQGVCDRLATESSYRFAWIGRPRASDGELTPTAWAGAGHGRVDDLATGSGNGSPGQQPAVIAANTREVHVVEALRSDPPFEPWRKEALKRGYRSVLSVPLLYEDSLYGVLTVFADQKNVFSGMERRVLEELGGTIAHAINALESKRALVSDEVVELEFRIRDPNIPTLRLVAAAECEFEFENVVTQEDGTYRGYFTTRGAAPEDVEAFAESSAALRDLELIADEGEECLFECELTAESLVATLLDHGAVPRSIDAADGQGRIVVTMARDADVREFADMLAAKYPESELTARRTRQQDDRTHQTFKADFESRLTERQRETLETAYFSGFFESPRKRTGQEIGETLGVSQPTVNHHLRASQRKLLGMLYEEAGIDETRDSADDSR